MRTQEIPQKLSDKYPEDLEKKFLDKLSHNLKYLYRVDGTSKLSKKRMLEIVNDTSADQGSIEQGDKRFNTLKFNWPSSL